MGRKKKFEIDQEIEIFNTKINILNGIHRIVDVPKNGYIINNRNSSPCFCFVVPIYINEDFPSNYKYSGSSSILETNYEGGWGMRLPIRASTANVWCSIRTF